MGDLIVFPKRPAAEPLLRKRQLGAELGYSKRWVEMRMRDGMPYRRLANGHTRFLLSEVLAWLDTDRSA